MLLPAEFRSTVLGPALTHLGLQSPAAEALLLGTALAESGLRALCQQQGPALGLFQMEPATHHDIHDNFLAYRPTLREGVMALAAPSPELERQLIGNLYYAAAMCRVHYRRVSAALPDPASPHEMALYWKAHYNTARGKGRTGHFERLYQRHVLPLYQMAS